MIITKGNQKTLEFGDGDILIQGGIVYTSPARGLVTFNNQEPRPIGKNPDWPEGKTEEVSPEYGEVRMTFTRIESIDCVIRQLQEMKQKLINQWDKEGSK